MKHLIIIYAVLVVPITAHSQQVNLSTTNLEERNKRIARNFYQDLWFTNNTDKYAKYVASEYVVHDIGDRKGVTEPAIEQKYIADFFWKNVELGGQINYQVAEGDLVATHWTATTESTKTILGRFIAAEPFYIINVMRFNEEGKIVEFWNQRHDIDTPQTLKFTLKGLMIGLLIALIPTFIAIRMKRKLKVIQKQ
ncbi:ester cyclase [Hanstruepera flava]|uniref:ester cyclase n=1 Tax=Hanstruepera flava TaxID=2930218 RepID=UPI0020291A3C|nr:ester cyclase [Hanstruepera flava]